jgi:hypothetical protein
MEDDLQGYLLGLSIQVVLTEMAPVRGCINIQVTNHSIPNKGKQSPRST